MRLEQQKREIQNLAANPFGNISPTLNLLASNQGRVLSAAKDIGNTMGKVDKDFADKFKSPTATLFADKFKGWSDHSSDALKASMVNAGLQRENFRSDEAALGALVKKNQESQGNLAAIQTLGEINAAQIQESQKLRDLLSQQVLAQNVAMEAQALKQDNQQLKANAVHGTVLEPTEILDTGKTFTPILK